MAGISITTHHGTAHVRFAYDPDAVEIIRQVPGRYWSKEQRRWEIDAADVTLAASLFHKAGHTVSVDGKMWVPPAQHKGTSKSKDPPLTTFVRSLPPRLHEPVCKALMKVLHPDVGGDTALMQELNEVRGEG